jgi:pimeloyl-ACP methyl ester carboxylesterase
MLVRAIALYVMAPYLAILVLFAVFQRRLMYHPSVAFGLKVVNVGLDPEASRDVEIRTPDGETLRGWLLAPRRSTPDPARPLMIYFPGNAENRLFRLADLHELAADGFDVLIFDYRGFGDSTGSSSEKAMTADAMLIWNKAIEELGYDSRKTVIYGESLGGAVAIALCADTSAAQVHPAAIVLNSTFASMRQIVADQYPLFPFRFFVWDDWPSIDRVARIQAPITIFHGSADEIVPVEHARQLAKTIGDKVHYVELDKFPHNSIPGDALGEELRRIRRAMDVR